MYGKLKEMARKKDRGEMRNFIENTTVDELSQVLRENICNAEIHEILDKFFDGFGQTEASQLKRRKIVEGILKDLRRARVTSSHVDTIVNRIVRDFAQYDKSHLLKLVEFSQERITLNDDDFTSWKDTLPLMLEILTEEKYLEYKGKELSGPQYVSCVVGSICDCPWNPAILTSLAKMFGEMSLEKKSDRELVTRALCDKLGEAELNEMPPLVHQLLRLCSNRDARLVLRALQKFFTDKYAEVRDDENPESMGEIGLVSLKEVQETESTVLFHIYQAVKLDHTKLKDFVNSLKKIKDAPEFILDSFIMAVLLSVSNIYEDQIFQILKEAMRRKIQDDEKRKTSAWLRNVLSDDWKIVRVVEVVISNSTKDRHLVIEGLVTLAFVLMDNEARTKHEDQQLFEIGIRIIQKLIRYRHEIVASVLQTLTEKIVKGGSSISQYTDCLSYVCRKLTLVVLDSQAKIVILLEQLMAIPGSAAKQVLHAILPLMRVSSPIRNTLVLILRKALYGKGIHTRQMAIIGFLQLLKNFRITDQGTSNRSNSSTSSSIFTQVTVERRSQVTKNTTRCDAAQCHEVLSILKRCFTHELQVRSNLYSGLDEAVSLNPELSEYAMELLMSHFNVYYEADPDIQPPLKFHICSDIQGIESVLREPIGELINVMQRIYVKMASGDSAWLDKVSLILESLCERMAKTELEHLCLDDRTDLLDNVPKSQQKLQSLVLVLTVYEALIAYRISGWSMESVSAAQSINSLFKSYSALVDFTKRVGKPKKGEGKKKDKDQNETTINNKRAGRPPAIKVPPTIMDFNTIQKMLCLLYEPSVPWSTREQAAVLKKRPEFHHYILECAIQLISNAKDLKNTDQEKHRESYVKGYLEMGELLYKRVVSEFQRIREFDEETAVLGLECFKQLCNLMCTTFPLHLSEFFARTCGIETAMGLSTQIQTLLRVFERSIESYLADEPDDEIIPKKIPVICLDLMAILLRKLDFESADTSEVFEWLKNWAQKTAVEAPIAIKLIEMLVMIEERNAVHGSTIDDLCIEICQQLGTIDKEEPSKSERYKSLTESCASQAHSILSNALKNKLNNAFWFLARLKSEQYIADISANETRRGEKMREKERSLCRQLCYNTKTLELLASAAIETGPNTDLTFKNLHQLYTLIGNLTRYFYLKSTPQNPAFESVKFVQLVGLAGSSLKPISYQFITHAEGHLDDNRRKADGYARRNKVLKETKFIPYVVSAIENFQKEIMQLSKKTRVPLENYLKPSVTRDYRIINPELEQGLERLDARSQINDTISTRPDELDETENPSERSESAEPSPPPSKRLRLDE